MQLKSFLTAAIAFASVASFAATTNSTTGTLPQHRSVMDVSEYKPHVGAQLGFSEPEGSYQTGSEIGVDVGYQPAIPYGVGFEFIHARAQSQGNDVALDRTVALAKGTYNFGGDIDIIKDSYVGVGVGAAFVSGATALTFGPLVGFDIPLNKRGVDNDMNGVVTLGALAKYLILEGSNPDTFALNGMMKYWF